MQIDHDIMEQRGVEHQLLAEQHQRRAGEHHRRLAEEYQRLAEQHKRLAELEEQFQCPTAGEVAEATISHEKEKMEMEMAMAYEHKEKMAVIQAIKDLDANAEQTRRESARAAEETRREIAREAELTRRESIRHQTTALVGIIGKGTVQSAPVDNGSSGMTTSTSHRRNNVMLHVLRGLILFLLGAVAACALILILTGKSNSMAAGIGMDTPSMMVTNDFVVTDTAGTGTGTPSMMDSNTKSIDASSNAGTFMMGSNTKNVDTSSNVGALMLDTNDSNPKKSLTNDSNTKKSVDTSSNVGALSLTDKSKSDGIVTSKAAVVSKKTNMPNTDSVVQINSDGTIDPTDPTVKILQQREVENHNNNNNNSISSATIVPGIDLKSKYDFRNNKHESWSILVQCRKLSCQFRELSWSILVRFRELSWSILVECRDFSMWLMENIGWFLKYVKDVSWSILVKCLPFIILAVKGAALVLGACLFFYTLGWVSEKSGWDQPIYAVPVDQVTTHTPEGSTPQQVNGVDDQIAFAHAELLDN